MKVYNARTGILSYIMHVVLSEILRQSPRVTCDNIMQCFLCYRTQDLSHPMTVPSSMLQELTQTEMTSVAFA